MLVFRIVWLRCVILWIRGVGRVFVMVSVILLVWVIVF